MHHADAARIVQCAADTVPHKVQPRAHSTMLLTSVYHVIQMLVVNLYPHTPSHLIILMSTELAANVFPLTFLATKSPYPISPTK